MHTIRLSEKAEVEMIKAIILSLFISPAFAGGADETVDPLNGCFQRVGYSGEEIAIQQEDFVNNRKLYMEIPDPERFKVSKLCWEGKARCITTATVCRENGRVAYTGTAWWWRKQ